MVNIFSNDFMLVVEGAVGYFTVGWPALTQAA